MRTLLLFSNELLGNFGLSILAVSTDELVVL